MGGGRFSFPGCIIASKRAIDLPDVLLLRSLTFPRGVTTTDEAGSMLDLHRACEQRCPEWDTFFVESLAAYVAGGAPELRSIDDMRAAWAMLALSRNGIIEDLLEFEILIHAIELSIDAHEALNAFALDQIRIAILGEERAALQRTRPPLCAVTRHDLPLIWRILRPAVFQGRLLLSPIETDALKAIDALAPPEAHDRAWNSLIRNVVTLERPSGLAEAERRLNAVGAQDDQDDRAA